MSPCIFSQRFAKERPDRNITALTQRKTIRPRKCGVGGGFLTSWHPQAGWVIMRFVTRALFQFEPLSPMDSVVDGGMIVIMLSGLCLTLRALTR